MILAVSMIVHGDNHAGAYLVIICDSIENRGRFLRITFVIEILKLCSNKSPKIKLPKKQCQNKLSSPFSV